MKYSIGIDEVGRGAVAGPVVVGAVALEENSNPDLSQIFSKGLRDSKKATKKQRQQVDFFVRETCHFGIGVATAAEVEAQGIVSALRLAAGRALDEILEKTGGTVSIQADAGLFHPYEEKYSTKRSIKADENILEVLLASHVAKEYRDNLMINLGENFPIYHWEKNVGYGTKEHFQALRQHGLSPHHRQSFLKRL